MRRLFQTSALLHFLLLLGNSQPALAQSAPIQQRFAVSRLQGESLFEAAAAFELACLKMNRNPGRIRPVQDFDFEGEAFLRIEVEDRLPHLCLEGLPPGRFGVDGSFQWFDGFKGGLLVPGNSPPDPALDPYFLTPNDAEPDTDAFDPHSAQRHESRFDDDRVPDPLWYHPDSRLPRAKLDPELSTALAQASQTAIDSLSKREHAQQWAALDGILVRQGAASQLALERLVSSKALWTVRRAALKGMDPSLAWSAVQTAARDEHPGLRMSAIPLLALYEERLIPGPSEQSEQARELLSQLLSEDPSWSVRRAVVFALSLSQASSFSRQLHQRLRNENSGDVAAAILELLDAAGELKRSQILNWVHDPRRPLSLSALSSLVRHMRAEDAALLWEKFTGSMPDQAHATVGLLLRIDDESIRPALWPLYLREAERLDANTWYLKTMLDYMLLHPPENAADLIVDRLNGPTSDAERRLLGRILGQLAPRRAEALFLPQLASPEPAKRAIAADVLPDTPEIRQRRLALIDSDPESDVRASALIGWCRAKNAEPGNLLSRALLIPTALGEEALEAFQRCGEPLPQSQRFKTQLMGSGPGSSPQSNPSNWVLPALAAFLLLLGSVLAEKLRKQE